MSPEVKEKTGSCIKILHQHYITALRLVGVIVFAPAVV